MADTSILSWLGRASICGIAEIERAAKVMQNYYQGVGPEPEYDEQATTAKNAAVRFDGQSMPQLLIADVPESRNKAGDFEAWARVYTNWEMLDFGRQCRNAALASRPAEVDDPFGPQRFLNWNRCQETPPVAIGKEMYVAQKAVELSRSAPSHTTNKEK